MATEEKRCFTHPPLTNASSEIRLLKIPSRLYNGSSPVQVEQEMLNFGIEIWPIDKAPPYFAISYTWGSPTPLAGIWINGDELLVRTNAHCALWQCSLHYHGSYVWIDSVCIDQENLAEKSAQVRLMAQVYRCAEATLSSFGPGCEGSDGVIASLNSFRPNPDFDYNEWDGALDHFSEAGSIFTNHAYWSRLWIVQELRLAKRVDVMWGSRHVQDVGKTLERDAEYVLYPNIGSLYGNPDIPYTRLGKAVGRRDTEGLRGEIMSLSYFECADIRDHVYGAFGLCYDDPLLSRITVDYSETAVALAARLASLETTTPGVACLLHVSLHAMRIEQCDADFILHRDLCLEKMPNEDIFTLAKELTECEVPQSTISDRIVSEVCSNQPLSLSEEGLALDRLYCERGELPDGQYSDEMVEWSYDKSIALYASFHTHNDVYVEPLTEVLMSSPDLQPIWHKRRIIGAMTSVAKRGDILVHFRGGAIARLLIVRQSKDLRIHQIIGQGIMLPHLGLRASRLTEEGREDVGSEIQHEDKDESGMTGIRLAMHHDDLFQLLTKFYYEKLEVRAGVEGDSFCFSDVDSFIRAVVSLSASPTLSHLSSFAITGS